VASDVIWREVCRLGGSGKPVFVSMGIAARGYYIACGRVIVAAIDTDRLDWRPGRQAGHEQSAAPARTDDGHRAAG
jgi:hypothetical protein